MQQAQGLVPLCALLANLLVYTVSSFGHWPFAACVCGDRTAQRRRGMTGMYAPGQLGDGPVPLVQGAWAERGSGGMA